MNAIASVVDIDLGPTFKIIAVYTISIGLCGMCGILRNNKSCFPWMHFCQLVLSNDINKMAIVNHAVQTKLSYSNSVLGE